MPARAGNWELLHESSDPVVADVATVQDLVHYYTTIAQEISAESDVLRRIGDGDTAEFKGESADAVRKKSKDVAESLQKMSGRYDAIRDALTGYLPELERALSESAAALRDAEDASASGARAASMADPSQNRAQDAPPLTSDESAASDGADAAVARLRRAVDGINGAGKAAASTIRAAWDDGLHDSLGDKIKAFFSKLLKIIVKIFTYIGIALAALAILIPGVGMLTFMAAVAASVVLVANITLAGMGEGSWLDVITSAVGLVLVGVGGALTKAVSTLKTAGLAKGAVGFEKNALSKIDEVLAASTPGGFKAARDGLRTITQDIKKVQDGLATARSKNVIDGFKEKPNWWHPGKALWAEDKAKFRDVLVKRDWRAERLFSVDRQNEMLKMQKEMWSKYGVQIAASPTWHSWAAGGRVVASWGNTIIYGQGLKPTGFGTDQQRLPGYNEVAKIMTHGF
jgi:hypothetical protein